MAMGVTCIWRTSSTFFVKTDQSQNCYFEYEISLRGYHLVLRVSGSWHPWSHEGKKRMRRVTSVVGGEKKHGAAVDGWSAEFFLPYELTSNFADEPPPGPGTRWRANFYRIDYDVSDGVDPESIFYWTWAPLVGIFHQVDKFGVLVFGEPAVATRQNDQRLVLSSLDGVGEKARVRTLRA